MAANDNDPRTARLAFREILARPGVTVMPGGFSPFYARMCQEIGFECFFVAGSQMSAFLLGVPDNGIMGLRDLVDHVRHIAARTTIPILVDADTAFGNAVNVTLGLPILRTSVDHGTALSLARTGEADAGSLRAALGLAIDLAGTSSVHAGS